VVGVDGVAEAVSCEAAAGLTWAGGVLWWMLCWLRVSHAIRAVCYQNMGSVVDGPRNIRDGLSVVCVAYVKSASQCCPHFPSAVAYLSEPGQGAVADSDTLPR
jgi:hypothetical protein